MSWEIWEASFESQTVVIIARAHLAQRKVVQFMGSSVRPTSVGVTDGYEHCTITGFLCAQVNCDATTFRDVGVVWMVREVFVIIFIVKNIYILFVKQSENKAASCLARLFVSQSDCIVSSGGLS